MKLILTLFFFSIINYLNANKLIIDIRGYYENDEIVMDNGSKFIHYKSKGNWSDSNNNYGKFKCKGSVLIEKTGRRSDKELTLCELEDVTGEFIWLIPKRSNSEWEAGVGKIILFSATPKYKDLIEKECVYAVTYYKDTFHTKTKCEY